MLTYYILPHIDTFDSNVNQLTAIIIYATNILMKNCLVNVKIT